MNILVIDCYDSFTYNLCQQFGAAGCDVAVVRNDAPAAVLRTGEYDRVVLSPGPGIPEQSGLCLTALHSLSRSVPTLGICLGHQAICVAFEGRVGKTTPFHGKVSGILHDNRSIFKGLQPGFRATRYHSLAAERRSLPACLEVTAISSDDGCIMGLRHREYPIEGVQFHPESIMTTEGDRLIRNFLKSGVKHDN
ncbi:MAG TPA: aminodeoxychorismate/anthranilate synthase component II [Methanoculleus sp.]|nr:aminodeoxychorismate/anthranilate synthase component II [Methanoculleus sp.]